MVLVVVQVIGSYGVVRFCRWLCSKRTNIVDVGLLGGAMFICCFYLNFFAMKKVWDYFFAFKVCYVRDNENMQVNSASDEYFDEV